MVRVQLLIILTLSKFERLVWPAAPLQRILTYVLNAKFRERKADVESSSDEHVGGGDEDVGECHVTALVRHHQ